MLNQNDMQKKYFEIREGVQNLWNRLHHKFDQKPSDQADGIVDAPKAEKDLVWDDDKNENTVSGQESRYS